MAEKYLYCQTGKVEDVIFPGKAFLTFLLHGKPQRVLLWVKCFIYQGKTLEQTDNFIDKLSVGDTVYFDCHVYDKESRDHCQWYAAKASKDMPEEMQMKTVPRVRNQNGYISEVDPGKGVITFDFYDEEQRVIFVRSRFYYFGKRMSNKKNLRDFLSENDPLQFDAEQCEPSEDNYYCTWFATQVWKGKRPTTQGSTWTLSGPSDDLTADDSASNAGGIIRDTSEDFPSLGLPQGLTEKQGYKAFEVNTSVREGKGNVLSLFNEECGLALWMVRHNTWETVFFHRKNTYLDSIHLSNFDLQESFSEGTPLEIQAVPAVPEFPCRWIAQKAIARY
ncbi:uncharacterized protein LOC125033330 [Penaeus chinensis]|uniref:uncharacterized protein LOC125033330 n=1 Tax=Penaeus chinensis TaxID=139456 RepID=UPI001FB5F3FA|nr:uncharacterized protein LOC125033330 [Penaeus chinensis]XP_047480689.1 uncharacterized protein LOC125033330 [Penaeus chinensis]